MNKQLKILLIIYPLIFVGLGCEDDDSAQNENGLIGSWQLAYYQTSDGRIDDLNDGKPVYWDLKVDSTYTGMAGNNEILGIYKSVNDTIFFTLAGSEMIGTTWEERFYDAINPTWNGEHYVMPYSLDDNELILTYSDKNTMHFVPR